MRHYTDTCLHVAHIYAKQVQLPVTYTVDTKENQVMEKIMTRDFYLNIHSVTKKYQ